MNKNILSIQSQVATGYVGNNIAGFAIQLHGINVINIPTVLFSTHTDSDVFYGSDTALPLFTNLLRGIQEHTIYNEINSTISGYINSLELIEKVRVFMDEWKQNNRNGVYLYDPVFGEVRTKGLYIPEEVAMASISKLLPICDLLTPNHFELEFILKEKFQTIRELLTLIANHPILSKKKIILTSAQLSDTPTEQIETLYIERDYFFRYSTQRVLIDVVGTGDLFTAIVTAQLCLSHSIISAIEIAVKFISNTLELVDEKGLKDMNAETILESYSHFLHKFGNFVSHYNHK